jgi:hypothetical protein
MASWIVRDHEINDFNANHITIEAQGIGDPPVRGDSYTILVHDRDALVEEVELNFQRGGLNDLDGRPNGITDEALLAVVLDRLRKFNDSPYRCRQNSLAITKIEEALMWLRDRSEERTRRGVEGTSKV